MGSGKQLRRAIKKYGVDKFDKCILFVFDNEKDMDVKEKELVTEEFCLRKDTYNICEGGRGGFSFIHRQWRQGEGLNSHQIEFYETYGHEGTIVFQNKIKSNTEFKDVFSQKIKEGLKQFRIDNPNFKWGNSHKQTDESKRKIGLANKKMTGQNNSQYGTMWVTNGISNKKLLKDEPLPIGWKKGRVQGSSSVVK